jgi:hypothetical protein
MANLRPIEGEQTILRSHSASGGQAHVVGMLLDSVILDDTGNATSADPDIFILRLQTPRP